jgi:hypothetical protein
MVAERVDVSNRRRTSAPIYIEANAKQPHARVVPQADAMLTAKRMLTDLGIIARVALV